MTIRINLKWAGTYTGILGACLLASNTAASPWGYPFFLLSAVCWTTIGVRSKDTPMILLNGFYVLVNVLGIVRWFHLI